MNKLTFEGTVFRGEGNGKKFLQLPWVKQQVESKLGFTPFFGTLNLKLEGENITRRKRLTTAASITICPNEGYCVGALFKAQIKSVDCAVVLPKTEDYPEDVLEVIAAVNLRENLTLRDGDRVVVSVGV